MEEKLTFTRVPRSVYWLCRANLGQSKKSYTAIVDYFQTDPFLRNLLKTLLPSKEGSAPIEAQLAGYGVKGFRDKLSEMYLRHLDEGKFPNEVELDLILEVQEFEQRFERFSVLGDYRVFMLGVYLKMRDLESLAMHGRQTSFLSLPIEVDEILAEVSAKIPRLDWAIVVLSSLLKFWSKEKVMTLAKNGEEKIVEGILKLDDKNKMTLLNDVMAYGHALDEKDFFLYQKV